MKWGLIGYGAIAQKFLSSLEVAEGQELIAIATRSAHHQAQEKYTDVTVYSDYQSIVEHPEVEAIYISTTHNFHHQHALLALTHGKHVLCEKPLTTSYDLSSELYETAARNNGYLLEAIWTRFLPAYRRVMHLVREGAIGKVRHIDANFSFKNNSGDENRLLNKSLAGGATYDVGIYNLSLALDILGYTPNEVSSVGNLTHTEVDGHTTTLLTYNDAIAALTCSINLEMNHTAILYGEEGTITIPMHWKAQEFLIEKKDGHSEKISLPYTDTGYYHEIMAMSDDIKNGRLQSALHTPLHSLAISKIIDHILDDIGYTPELSIKI